MGNHLIASSSELAAPIAPCKRDVANRSGEASESYISNRIKLTLKSLSLSLSLSPSVSVSMSSVFFLSALVAIIYYSLIVASRNLKQKR